MFSTCNHWFQVPLPPVFDAMLLSISRASRGESHNSAAKGPSKVMRKPDKSNIPSGLQFNRVAGGFEDEARWFQKPDDHKDSDKDSDEDMSEESPEVNPNPAPVRQTHKC